MYTVLRFFAIDDVTLSRRLGECVNAVIPGAYGGPDVRHRGFSISVSSEETWLAHRDEIVGVVLSLQSVLEIALEHGVALELDTMCDLEDYGSRWITELRFDRACLEVLSRFKVELVVSVYAGGSPDETATPEVST